MSPDTHKDRIALASATTNLAKDEAAGYYVKDESVSVVFALEAGELMSREGVNRYAARDAVITAANGDRWSVTRERFHAKYIADTPTNEGEDGVYRARPVEVLAKQMTSAFSIQRMVNGDLLLGNAFDWLLQYAPGDFGIVERQRFARVYKRS